MPEGNKIMWLLSVFDNPRSSAFEALYKGNLRFWHPETEEEKKAFAELISLENRQQLKNWYARSSSINDAADIFRHVLEDAIGEALPLMGEEIK